MNIFKFFSVIAVLILLSSCSGDNSIPSETVTEFSPQSYHFENMDYPVGMVTSSTLDNLVKIIYDGNNKIIRRVGGILYYSAGSGMTTGFTDVKYDDVEYVNNEIHITSKISLIGYTVPSFERKWILDNNNNRIVRKIIFQENVYPQNDTINYSYNNLGKINETFKGDLDSFNEKSKFYYNSNGNLDSIVATKHYQNEPFSSKTKEVFSNFDNIANPIKKLIIFEETFNRAISNNNYSKYEKFIYDSSNNLISSEIKNWTLQYDSSGNINFNLN
jgi:hypothetical protein